MTNYTFHRIQIFHANLRTLHHLVHKNSAYDKTMTSNVKYSSGVQSLSGLTFYLSGLSRTIFVLHFEYIFLFLFQSGFREALSVQVQVDLDMFNLQCIQDAD